MLLLLVQKDLRPHSYIELPWTYSSPETFTHQQSALNKITSKDLEDIEA